MKEFFKVIPADTNTGLFIFDANGAREVSPIAPTDSASLSLAINEISPGSRTPLGKSIRYAYQKLTDQAQLQQGYGEYHLVVITDGAASDETDMKRNITRLMKNSPINVHTIGFCLGEGHSLNQPGSINYKSAFNSNELTEGLRSVLSEAESFDASDFQGD